MDIKSTREALGWTQTRLAFELGISKPFMCEMEKGKEPVSRRTELALRYLRINHGVDRVKPADAA